MYSLVFDVEWRSVPSEKVCYDGVNETLHISLAEETDEFVNLSFVRVCGIRLTHTDCIDREMFFFDGFYHKALIQDMNSSWVAQVLPALQEQSRELIELKHYLLPSDKGVWEFLATSVTLSE